MIAVKPIFKLVYFLTAHDDLRLPFDRGDDLQPAIGIYDHVLDEVNVEDVGAVDTEEDLGVEKFIQVFECVVHDELLLVSGEEVNVSPIGKEERDLVGWNGADMITQFHHEARLVAAGWCAGDHFTHVIPFFIPG